MVNAGANLAPGNGGNNTAILQTGALTLAATSNFRVDINGTTVGTGYDQIQMNTGAIRITNSNLVVTVGTTLSVGQTFTILNKVSGGAITGTFAGIPQGGTVVGSDGTVFSVSYTGGDGNDVVLTVHTVRSVATPVFFTPLSEAIGVAVSPLDMYVTGWCDQNLYGIDCVGNSSVLGMIPLGDRPCMEKYVAIAPSQSANAGFAPRDVFITEGQYTLSTVFRKAPSRSLRRSHASSQATPTTTVRLHSTM